MNRFEEKLTENGLRLRRASLQTLQISVGRKCNQACRHCHVDAGPWRTEMVSRTVAHRIGDWIGRYHPEVLDITGGAPELSEFFRYFVETGRAAGARVANSFNPTTVNGLMCRTSLSVGWMGEVYDCDFNQMLGMQMRNGKPLYLWDVRPEFLQGWAVVTGEHCLACTAGCGSSCTGALETKAA